MNLDTAVASHAEWILKFRSPIASKEQMDLARISKDHVCGLGLWLHGEAKAKYGRLASYQECLSAHSTFHREAGKIAQRINEQKYLAAEAALAPNTPYSAASNVTATAIIKLKREAGL